MARPTTRDKMKKQLIGFIRFASAIIKRFPKLVTTYKAIIERFPKLLTIFKYVRHSWQIYEEPQETPMGFKFVGNKSMLNGLYEPEETQIVKQLLSGVDVFINVGANVGYYCCIALSQGKNVVAFEPISLNLRYLLRNIKANNWESRIEVYPMALSNKSGAIEIYGDGTDASLLTGWASTSERHVTLVSSTTLDNALGTRFKGQRCLILVDVEGAELLMLEGASSVINMEPKPIWLMEISIFGAHRPKGATFNPNLSSTFHVFWRNGYEAWTADRQCRIIHPSEIEKVAESGIDTFHTHNFLFIEKGKKPELINPQHT